MKKVGKITRPFRYDLNKILYDYLVEVTKRVKGFEMIDRVPNDLWTEVNDIVQEIGINHPHGKEMQKSEMAVWGGLAYSYEKKRRKSKGEKERYKHLNAEFQRTAKR